MFARARPGHDLLTLLEDHAYSGKALAYLQVRSIVPEKPMQRTKNTSLSHTQSRINFLLLLTRNAPRSFPY